MKKRTRISIRTRQTVRVDGVNLRCPQCGTEVSLASAEMPAADPHQLHDLQANAESDQMNSLICGHLLSDGANENKD